MVDRWAGIVLGVVAGVVYFVIGPDKAGTDSHYLFAQAFLDGRVWIEGDYPWLELVPRPGGGWYTPFPPLLSAFFAPFAAAGIEVDTNLFAAVMGGLSVALVWEMALRLDVARRSRYALLVAWAFGSQMLWVAGEGGQHLAPQVTAAALLAGAITLGLHRQTAFLAGLLLGSAAAARLPVGLALPLILWLYRPSPDSGSSQRLRPWLLVLTGVAIPAVLVAVYNLARFGSPAEFGYGLIENAAGQRVLDEPWYSEGIVSLAYLPQGIHTMLFRGLAFQDAFPWIYADGFGASVVLTTPLLLWIFNARGRLALAAGVAAVLVLLPNLLHGNPGWQQVGYRFLVDAMPMLWLMLGLALRRSMSPAAFVAWAIGLAVNVWLAAVFWSESVR